MDAKIYPTGERGSEIWVPCSCFISPRWEKKLDGGHGGRRMAYIFKDVHIEGVIIFNNPSEHHRAILLAWFEQKTPLCVEWYDKIAEKVWFALYWDSSDQLHFGVYDNEAVCLI